MGVLDYIIFGTFIIYLVREAIIKFDKTESINSYAIGNRLFSTFALGATITATWISGSGFVLDLAEFHKDGMKYFLASIGMCLNLTIMAIWLVPHMESFLGKTSVSAIMAEHYGVIIQNITTFLGVVTTCGGIAVQFKIMGNVIYYIFPWLNSYICTIIGGILTTAYTYSGGIRSVVRTDIVQAICFTLSLIIAIATFNTTISMSDVMNNMSETALDKFTFKGLLTLTSSEILDLILLTGYFLVPGLKPQVIQRVSMGKNLEQVKKSYFYSSICLFIILCLSCYLSYLIFLVDQKVTTDDILHFLINMYNIPGTKAILVIGVMAMCMSTADSNLNICSVLLANDSFFSKKLNPIQKIFWARNFTLVLGAASILWAFWKTTLFKFILFSASFYLPIISVPLLGVVLKWKTSSRVCLSVIIICSCFVAIFKITYPDIDINFIGMILNAILLITGHYIVEKWELLKCFGIRSQLKGK